MNEKPIILVSKTHFNDKYASTNKTIYRHIKYKPAFVSETSHKQNLQFFLGNRTMVLIMNV